MRKQYYLNIERKLIMQILSKDDNFKEIINNDRIALTINGLHGINRNIGEFS